MLRVALVVAAGLAADPALGQTQPAAGEVYSSYVSVPAQDNVPLRNGLDADELVGGLVQSPQGTRLGMISDLLVGADGTARKAAVDLEPGVEGGGRHVAVDLARLLRVETGDFVLEMSEAELKALPTYREEADRWHPVQ
jgi:hypothetical protein